MNNIVIFLVCVASVQCCHRNGSYKMENMNFGKTKLEKFLNMTDFARKLCKNEIMPSIDDMKSINKDRMPNSTAGKCMFTCQFKKMGIITADNKYNSTGLQALLSYIMPIDQKIIQLTQKCEMEIKPNPNECEFGGDVKLCLDKYEKEFLDAYEGE